MIKKNPIIFVFITVFLFYLVYKLAVFFILDSKITHDNSIPKIKLSKFVTISENRVKYVETFYIEKKFIGFNAFIDKKYFITVTKLGRASKKYKIIRSKKKAKNSSNINLIDQSVADKNENSRYIDLHNYPPNIKKLYFYADNHIFNINQSKFYEVETVFNFFNFSFENETNKDFGFAGVQKEQSVSLMVIYL